jgi:hypothetical protein
MVLRRVNIPPQSERDAAIGWHLAAVAIYLIVRGWAVLNQE